MDDKIKIILSTWDDLYACETLEELANYADHLTTAYCKDFQFNRTELLKYDEGSSIELYKTMEMRDFGNMSYLGLYGHCQFRKLWRKLLEIIIEENNLPFRLYNKENETKLQSIWSKNHEKSIK